MNKILCCWFGVFGLLSSKTPLKNPDLRRDLLQWSDEWEKLEPKIRLIYPLSGSTRLGNAPERRLVGMYHHLALTANPGLFKSWLMLLSQISQREHDKSLRRVILELSQEIFETPNWEV